MRSGNELQGEIFLVKLNDKNQHVPLHATLGETYRFFGESRAATTPMCPAAGR